MAVLISGVGTTLLNFINRRKAGELDVEIRIVIASTPHAPGLQHAEKNAIPIAIVDRKQYATQQEFSDVIFDHCRKADVDVVALAGFLKFLNVPEDFEGRVLNIHPALIPSFCGKGYYGRHIHESVIDHGNKISGCTVHFVTNQYDRGPIILQRAVPVLDDDRPEDLDERVRAAEREVYPEALRLYAAGRLRVEGRRVRILPA